MTRYLIRVDRRLSDELTSAFPHLFSETQPVQTVLMGNFTDPEELSGVLNYLGEMGISIIELVRIPDEQAGRWAAPA
ncbi:MAG: hypothetical protein ACRDO0_16735 [Nocardioidaceae bacterium]